jgi:hypothetical protein
VDMLFVHFGIAKRDTPMSGGQLSAHQAEFSAIVEGQLSMQWSVEIWMIGNPVGICI